MLIRAIACSLLAFAAASGYASASAISPSPNQPHPEQLGWTTDYQCTGQVPNFQFTLTWT